MWCYTFLVLYVHWISSQTWYIDGTVKCFTGGHLPLAIVAILVLIFCVLVMVFVTAVVMRKIKVHVYGILISPLIVVYLLQQYWALPMAEVLKVPFTEGHSLWASVELLQRILFVIFIIILPGNLVSIYIIANAYKSNIFAGSCDVIHHGLCDSDCLHQTFPRSIC